MISDYGQQFNINIPIFGDLLYRSFFEIELPVLNFTDSVINDIRYTTYKKNQLNNLVQQMPSVLDDFQQYYVFTNNTPSSEL